MDSILITVGAGRRNPHGSRKRIEFNGEGSVASLARALADLSPAEDSWWSGHVFTDDRRQERDWSQSSLAMVDADFHVGAKKKPTPAEADRERCLAAARAGHLAGNVFHETPHGIRLLFVFSRVVTDATLMKAAVRGACAIAAAAIAAAGCAEKPNGNGEKHGFRVDSNARDLARFMFAPRCLVDGTLRSADVLIIRSEPYDPDDLAAAAPTEQPAPTPPKRTTPASASVGEIDDAVEKWNSDHPQDWPPKGRGDCPACGGKGGFGALPELPDKWFCWHQTHPDSCGQKTDRGHYGDALDIEAHARGCKRIDVLRKDGYLAPRCGATTKAGKTCASTDLLSDGRCMYHTASRATPAVRPPEEEFPPIELVGFDSADEPPEDAPPPSLKDAPSSEIPYCGDLPLFLTNSYASAVQIFSTNAGNILGNRRLGFNLMTGAPTADGRELQDHDVTAMRGALPAHVQGITSGKKLCEMSLARGDVWDAILEIAHRNEYHPVREYLRGLKWDGQPRIESVPWEIFSVDHESEQLCSVLLRRWFVSAVARPLSPGCKVDTMLILVGVQGLLKSSFFSVLAGEWFCDTAIDLHNKDAFMTLRGTWILEFAELSSLHRTRDAEAAKAFITSRADNYRAPYGRLSTTVPRSSVIVGTTNKPQFLVDETGSRRFWPVRPWRIDLKKLDAWRDQLWAEAVALYNAAGDCAACAAAPARRCPDHAWWLSTSEDAAVAAVHDEHFANDAWEQKILELVADGTPRTTGEILEGALKKPPGQWSRGDEMRVAAIMARDGWEHMKPHRGVRIWERTRPA